MVGLDIAIHIITARAQTESNIQLAIHSVINDKRATVGIAILCDDGNMVVMNDDERYPVMSVFKFHVVVTALKKWNNMAFRWIV